MIPDVETIRDDGSDNVCGNDCDEDMQEVEEPRPQPTNEAEDLEEQIDQLEDESHTGPSNPQLVTPLIRAVPFPTMLQKISS